MGQYSRIELEGSTHDVRNLAEWLELGEPGGLLFSLGEIDGDKGVWDLLFFADQGDQAGTSGHGETVECEDHDYSET